MALIQPGPLASDIRGSMGGSVFSRNRSGLYIRRRVSPVNPATPAQTAARNRISALQAAFRDTLTPAERSAWEALAASTSAVNKLGLGIVLTAQNLFVKINSLVLAAGETRLDTAPVPPAGIDLSPLTYTGTVAAGLNIASQATAQGAGDILVTQVSPAVNVTVNFFKGPWESTQYNVGVIAPPILLKAIGTVALGERYHIRSRFVSADGHISNYVSDIVDILT